MYWLRWHYHINNIAGAPYKILKKKKKQTKRQNRRQSVVAGRQQLYCAVQSRSPSHHQTATRKVQSSARDGTSSATVHSWQTTAGCSTHVPKPLGRHGHRVLNVWWTVPPAWASGTWISLCCTYHCYTAIQELCNGRELRCTKQCSSQLRSEKL